VIERRLLSAGCLVRHRAGAWRKIALPRQKESGEAIDEALPIKSNDRASRTEFEPLD